MLPLNIYSAWLWFKDDIICLASTKIQGTLQKKLLDGMFISFLKNIAVNQNRHVVVSVAAT